MSIEHQLAAGLARLAIPVGGEIEVRLKAYLALLQKWNQTYNLTAVREPEQMVSHHLFDSLAILAQVDKVQTLADIGSGGGLPGIPVAIALPQLAVTLVESSHKKAAFLRQVKLELGLENVSVVNERVEVWRPTDKFDVVISRAFADLAEFIQLAAHLVAANGSLMAMKGIYPHEELTKIPQAFAVDRVVELDVPDLSASRHLVVLTAA